MTMEDMLRDPETIPAVRRWLFEQLAAGTLPAGQAAAIARRIGVELEAGSYAVALFDLPRRDREANSFDHPADAARRSLHAFFLKYSEYMPAQLSPNRAAVLIKGERRRMAELTERCVAAVQERYSRAGCSGWHMAVSDPVDELEALPACCQEAERLWAMGYFRPDRQIFRPGEDAILPLPDEDDDGRLTGAAPDMAALELFLAEGRAEDAPAFADAWLEKLETPLTFLPFRHYTLLAARFAAERQLTALGLDPALLAGALPPWDTAERDPVRYLSGVLTAAAVLRDEARGASWPGSLGAAMAYVQDRFTDPDLTLSRAARAAGVTDSHLSALFRRELDRTFTQYVTEKRLELAKSLLRRDDMTVGRAAAAAGFRDARYFSTVFKKYTGRTPTEFSEK